MVTPRHPSTGVTMCRESLSPATDWAIPIGTVAAAVAAIAAVVSLAYAVFIARKAEQDRLLEQLQRISQLLVRIKHAALNDAHDWGQDRDFLGQALAMIGYLEKSDAWASLVHLENPIGDTPELKRAQKEAADTAACVAECALKDLKVEVEKLLPKQ
jgi:hypothetical protein